MRACELELLRANGAEPCLLMDTGGETGRISFSEAGLALRPGVNLLDNAEDFWGPINQRNIASDAPWESLSYGIDRWKSSYAGAGVRWLKDQGINLSSDIDASCLIDQIFERERMPSGEIFTLSAFVNQQIIYFSFDAGMKNSYYLNFDIEGTNILLNVMENFPQNGVDTARIWMNKAGNVLVRAAKLERGPYQTLGHKEANGNWVLNNPQPDKALELLKCQRYQLFGPIESLPFLNGIAFLPTPTTMRANPAIVGTPLVYDLAANEIVPDKKVIGTELYNNGIVLITDYNAPCYVLFPAGSGLDANL